MSYSKEGKFIYFKHGDEHDLQLTEMYRVEQFRTGSSERIGQYIAKHIVPRTATSPGGVFPCTLDRTTCEGCQKEHQRISAFKQSVVDLGDGEERWFEMPISLMKVLIEKQKTFRDLLPNDESVLTAGYRILKNAKGSDPLWTVTIIKKPVEVEAAPKEEPVELDLDSVDDDIFAASDRSSEGMEDALAPEVLFTRDDLEQVVKYNKRLANALTKNPSIDVATSLRNSLANVVKMEAAKVEAVIAAIGEDKLVDIQSLAVEA